MKKIVIILVAICVIGALAYYFVLTPQEEISIEQVLPPDAQLYIHFDNVEENVTQIASGQLWQSISNIDYNRLVQEGVLNPAQVMTFKMMQDKMNDPQIQLVLKKLFGQEFAFAVYPLSIRLEKMSNLSALTTPTFLDDALSNFMVISRIPPDMQVVEFFSGLVGNLGANARKETLNYKDYTIHSIIFDQLRMRVAYVRIKDLLVITLSDRAAQKVIDIHTGKRSSLIEDQRFAAAREERVPDSEIYMYWNMEQFFSYMRDQIDALSRFVPAEERDPNAPSVRDQLEEALQSVQGFKSLSLSGHLDQLTEFKFHMLLDVGRLSRELSAYYTCDPVKNRSLSFIPAGVMGYQWNACLQLEYYWDQMLEEIAKAQETSEVADIEAQVRQFETVLGLNIRRELIPAIGDEFGGFLFDIQVGGLFPIPKFVLFAKIDNKQRIDELLGLLTQNPLFVLQQETYGKRTINYFSSPLGGQDLQPSYCYIDDYLLIAINRQVMKASIDAHRDKSKSLLNDPSFNEIDKGLSDKNLNVFYAQMGRFTNKLENLIEWANNWANAQQQKREALKAGSQQRLSIVDSDIDRMQEDIEELEDNIEEVRVHMADFEAQGLDTSASQEELKNLSDMIDAKQSDLRTMEEEKEELEELIASYETTGVSSQKRELFLQNLVYPLLNGLSSIESFGGRTTITGDTFESTLLMKWTN